jgi:hypothetical protein
MVIVDRFFFSFLACYKWSQVVVDRRSLFGGSLSTNITWAGFRVVVIDRRLLSGGVR